MSELAMPRSWRRETKPHKFCPGCGHGLVLKALGMAVDRLEIAERVLFGCDIGVFPAGLGFSIWIRFKPITAGRYPLSWVQKEPGPTLSGLLIWAMGAGMPLASSI